MTRREVTEFIAEQLYLEHINKGEATTSEHNWKLAEDIIDFYEKPIPLQYESIYELDRMFFERYQYFEPKVRGIED